MDNNVTTIRDDDSPEILEQHPSTSTFQAFLLLPQSNGQVIQFRPPPGYRVTANPLCDTVKCGNYAHIVRYEASSFCNECRTHMCEQCFNDHNSNASFANHSVHRLSGNILQQMSSSNNFNELRRLLPATQQTTPPSVRQLQLCGFHDTMPIQYICDCNEVLCQLCVNSNRHWHPNQLIRPGNTVNSHDNQQLLPISTNRIDSINQLESLVKQRKLDIEQRLQLQQSNYKTLHRNLKKRLQKELKSQLKTLQANAQSEEMAINAIQQQFNESKRRQPLELTPIIGRANKYLVNVRPFDTQNIADFCSRIDSVIKNWNSPPEMPFLIDEVNSQPTTSATVDKSDDSTVDKMVLKSSENVTALESGIPPTQRGVDPEDGLNEDLNELAAGTQSVANGGVKRSVDSATTGDSAETPPLKSPRLDTSEETDNISSVSNSPQLVDGTSIPIKADESNGNAKETTNDEDLSDDDSTNTQSAIAVQQTNVSSTAGPSTAEDHPVEPQEIRQRSPTKSLLSDVPSEAAPSTAQVDFKQITSDSNVGDEQSHQATVAPKPIILRNRSCALNSGDDWNDPDIYPNTPSYCAECNWSRHTRLKDGRQQRTAFNSHMMYIHTDVFDKHAADGTAWFTK